MFPVGMIWAASFSVFTPPHLPARGPLEPTPAAVKQVISESLPLLTKGATVHAEKRTCFACHNQAIPMLAFAAAEQRGFELPRNLVKSQAEHVHEFLHANRDSFRKGRGTGGQVDTAGYALLTLELAGHKPDDTTEAVVEFLLRTQSTRDHWRSAGSRPPTQGSDFTTTYVAIRGLQHFATAEQKERAQKRLDSAKEWLRTTPAKETEDRVFRLLAFQELGVEGKDLEAAAGELQKSQRDDGGWAQTAKMASDPYATATALVALHRAGGLAPTDPAYRKGLTFLLRSRRADGSWTVPTRSRPIQPYYESGFPHGDDQFLSIATTGWAAVAFLAGK